MTRLASTLGTALVVLCGATIGADVTHNATARPAPGHVVTDPRQPVVTLSGPACVVPQSTGSRALERQRPNLNQPTARSVAQVTRNDRVDVTFELRQRDDGSVEVTGKSGELQISKRVTSDGGFVLELTASADHISITASGQGTTVARNGTVVSLSRASSTEENLGDVRRLLAGSRALLQFRRIASALTDAEDRSGAALSMVIADAVIGQLTGDVGAVRRAARYLAHNGSAKITPVALRPECFQTMESDMMFALNDYAACLSSVWGNVFWEDLCAWRWVVEVESVWFQFIACSGLGGIF